MRVRVKTMVVTTLLTLVLVAASTIAPIMGRPSNQIVGETSAPAVSSAGISTTSVAPGACGPIDLAIVLDNTGSMGGAINNIKAELPTIVATANLASGGDLRVGYITFGNTDINAPVIVHNNLTTNISAVMDSINNTNATDGGDAPEPSDEAKNTAINNLPAGNRSDVLGFIGTQVGDFSTPWRTGAKKIAVLITDAPPNGFSENATSSARPFGDPAYNQNINTTLPAQALAKGILFSDIFVNDSGDYASMPPFTGVGQKELLMEDANKTGGVFIEAAANGSGTGEAITSIVASCGGVTPTGRGNVTGGGWIVSPITPAPKNNNKATFGFVAHFTDNSTTPSGNLQYDDKAAGLKVHGNVTTLSVDKSTNTSIFSGTATITNATATIIGTYKVTAVDNGEPGKGKDTFAITLSTGYMANGTLEGGNIQLHDP